MPGARGHMEGGAGGGDGGGASRRGDCGGCRRKWMSEARSPDQKIKNNTSDE
jgi:hypothetical protein